MRPLFGFAWGLALAVLAVSGGTARAAWNNVFQVCCNHCQSAPAPVVAAYGADPCCAPPPTTCTTRYVQRSCYTPVTSYRTSYYYEPVTSYRTSYYYEPVTSYRYSCYYDPCTCRYQSVATPTTSYRLRSQCCPVTSYLQRTCMTPVTSYQQSFYYEPVTTCCTSTTGAPVASPPQGAVTNPPAGAAVTPAAPATGASREPMPPPPPGTTETREPGYPASDPYKAERSPALSRPGSMPPAADSSSRPRQRTAPPVRLDRIASRGTGNLEGKVLQSDRSPRSGAQVLLVSADARSNQQKVTADQDGVFRTRVEAGGWLVYTHDENGKPVFSRRVEVSADRPLSMTLTQR